MKKSAPLPDAGRLLAWLAPLLLALLCACTSVKFVGEYDEQIDKGVTALHRDTEALLLRLETGAGTPAAGFDANKKFYEDARLAISSLRLRADATERNSLTVRMLDRLRNNIERLARDHAQGIRREEVPLYRGGLDSQFTAILTFEFAKKRGEKPDEAKAALPATPASAGGR